MPSAFLRFRAGRLSLVAAGLAAAGVAFLPPGPRAADAPALTEEAARQVVESEVSSLPDQKARIERTAIIAFVREGVSPEIRRAAVSMLADFDPRLVADRTIGYFDSLPPNEQVELLGLLDRCFPDMKGYDFRLNAAVARAVASPDRAVRRTGSEMAGRYRVREAYFPLRKRANTSSGEDRLEAIRTMGQMRDGRAVWFLPDLLTAREPGVAEATIEALGGLGRTASVVLKEEMTKGSPGNRLLALRTLMKMPAVDDLPAYYEFVQAHQNLEEPLKTELYNLIAHLEIARDKGLESPRD